MSYTVVLAATPKRGLADGPPPPPAVAGLLAGPLCEDPRRAGDPVLPGLVAYRCARLGRWRVLYEIDEPRRYVIIHRIERTAGPMRAACPPL